MGVKWGSEDRDQKKGEKTKWESGKCMIFIVGKVKNERLRFNFFSWNFFAVVSKCEKSCLVLIKFDTLH